MRYILLFLTIGLIVGKALSQEDSLAKKFQPMITLGLGMGASIPLADLKERYGTNLNVSIQGEYINKNNWVYGAEALYFFGNNVKEDVLKPFRTSTGVILGDDNQVADIFLRQRGIFIGAGIGKLIPIRHSSRSGWKVQLSGGVLQHNIRFTDERNSVAQIRAGRWVGYDRLTRGFSLKESVGYKHISDDKRVNFELMFDVLQGFTSEVRAINFDTGEPTKSSRFDMLIGLRAIWIIPFYVGGGIDEVIYY